MGTPIAEAARVGGFKHLVEGDALTASTAELHEVVSHDIVLESVELGAA